jgi:hypothetical protein
MIFMKQNSRPEFGTRTGCGFLTLEKKFLPALSSEY